MFVYIFLVTLGISLVAKLYISLTYRKWNGVRNSLGMNGNQLAELIMSRTALGYSPYRPVMGSTSKPGGRGGIPIGRVSGKLTDHYDPRSNTVNLSFDVAVRPTVSSMAIVAHELEHAQQHEQNSILISIRNVLVPAVRLSPVVAFGSFFIGLLLNLFINSFMIGLVFMGIGVLVYGLLVVYAIITLPVEIDASRRGLQLLRESGIMQTERDESGARSVLTAAATTYIAFAIAIILEFLYFLFIFIWHDIIWHH